MINVGKRQKEILIIANYIKKCIKMNVSFSLEKYFEQLVINGKSLLNS